MSLRALCGLCRIAASSWVALSLACEEPEPVQSKPEPAETKEQEKPAEIAPKIASAMQAAAEQSAQADAPSDAMNPPPNGILDPGRAQAELPQGEAPRLVLGSTGSPPRVQLGAVAVGDAKAQLELQVRLGGSVMPTVQLELEQRAMQEGKAEPQASAVETGRRFEVVQANLASEQPGRLPPGAAQTIGRLKGARLSFEPAPEGGLQAGTLVLDKGKDDLRPLAVGALDAVSSLTLPVPSEPVGVGAYWMVKSRETFNEAHVVAYRMFRVTKVNDKQVELSLDIKRYLTEARLPLAGLPPHRVQEWRSEGKGTIAFDQSARLARSADLQDSFLAIVVPEEGASQAIPVQGETKAKMSRVAPVND